MVCSHCECLRDIEVLTAHVGDRAMDAEEALFYEQNRHEWHARAMDNVQMIIKCGAVDEVEAVVRDTICNLMHWCDELGIDFGNELRIAGAAFEAEKAGTI